MKNIWNRVSSLGLDKLKDPSEMRQITILNRIVFISMVNLFGLIFVGIYFAQMIVTLAVVAGIILASLALVLNGLGHFRAARVYFLAIAIIYISGIAILNGKDAGSQVSFILLSTLHLVLFKKSKWSYISLLLMIGVYAFTSWWVETHVSILDHLDHTIKRSAFYINILCNMLLVYCVVLYFKNAGIEHESIINRKNEEITEKNKNITDSIVYARRIQRSLLPPEKYIEKKLEKLKEFT